MKFLYILLFVKRNLIISVCKFEWEEKICFCFIKYTSVCWQYLLSIYNIRWIKPKWLECSRTMTNMRVNILITISCVVYFCCCCCYCCFTYSSSWMNGYKKRRKKEFSKIFCGGIIFHFSFSLQVFQFQMLANVRNELLYSQSRNTTTIQFSFKQFFPLTIIWCIC